MYFLGSFLLVFRKHCLLSPAVLPHTETLILWKVQWILQKANCHFCVFSKETVGEPFYLLVTTLNQKINKGPVDVITCKALYTLNEDWLLWQVPEFSTVVRLC